MADFYRALDETLKWEGGYANHPSDPGGATMKGVTQYVYDRYRKLHGLPPRSVKLIAYGEVRYIYQVNYWDVVWGNRLRPGEDLAVFDFAVNSGPSRAVRYLQRVVGAVQDGVMGAKTYAASRTFKAADVVRKLCDARLSFVQALTTWTVFGKGWARRIGAIRATGLLWANESPEKVKEDIAEIEDRADNAAENAGSVGTGGAVSGGGVAVVVGPDPWLWLFIGIGVVVVIVVALHFVLKSKILKEVAEGAKEVLERHT